jgi:hypothetical protein
MAMKTLALLAIAVVASAAAADVHPFTAPKVTGTTAFLETFSSGLGGWIAAKDSKYSGERRTTIFSIGVLGFRVWGFLGLF